MSRLLSRVVVMLLFALAVVVRRAPCEPDPSPAIHAVACIGVTVADMERSLAFYTQALDFTPSSDVELAGEPWEHFTGVFGVRMRVVTLALGDERLELTQFIAPEGRPIPPDSRSNDRWFQHIAIITPDMDRAYARLRAHSVRHTSSGPQTLPEWNPNAGGIKAFYFKDPDGHNLEVLQFPPDKGDPKWRALAASEPDRLFLGIDHTAIVVRDTETSLGFYRDQLGMTVAGASENFGPEQERLNNVFGARLRITALRAESGPGVELLEYLAPTDGRPMPIDSRANDLWHWHIRLISTPPALPVGRWISSGIIETPGDLGFSSGISMSDPDGHVVQIIHATDGIAEVRP